MALFCSADSKKFLTWNSLHKTPASLYGDSESKANMLIEKYKMIHQRTARHRLFAAPTISSDTSQNNFSLRAVEHLLGSSAKENNLVVLGMLTQLKEVKLLYILGKKLSNI